MLDVLVSPPVAFVIYMALVGALLAIGRTMATEKSPTTLGKHQIYASGEVAPGGHARQGYRNFVEVALFFAVLHLGVLVMATGSPGLATMLFLGLLVVILFVLMVG
ncbi:MAG: hypothetical protein HC915_16760 [Anaerolineae bacterium]|nr:hypothetical protein [Anaerolineae bacterium]